MSSSSGCRKTSRIPNWPDYNYAAISEAWRQCNKGVVITRKGEDPSLDCMFCDFKTDLPDPQCTEQLKNHALKIGLGAINPNDPTVEYHRVLWKFLDEGAEPKGKLADSMSYVYKWFDPAEEKGEEATSKAPAGEKKKGKKAGKKK